MMGLNYGSHGHRGDGLRNYGNTADCIMAWIRGDADGKNSSSASVYFIGRTIYSYGSHFPMAALVDGVALVTIDRYSSTTNSKHLPAVRRAVRQLKRYFEVVHVPGTHDGVRHLDNIRNYELHIREQCERTFKARFRAHEYLGMAQQLALEANEYAAHFGLSERVMVPTDIPTTKLLLALGSAWVQELKEAA